MSDANERLRQKAQNEQTCIALNDLLDTKDADLAAKDARIAELEQKIIGLEDYVASIPDYRHLCKELRDKLTAQQQAEPATHSEDGRECIARAFITGESGNGEYRVVMRFETLADMKSAHNYLVRANPARQVGGDEREQFEAWAQQNGISITRTPQALAFANGQRRTAGDYIMVESLCAYAAWQARAAALAPATVVVPDRKDVTLATQDDDWPEVVSRRMAQAHNAALDEVARLNRRAIPAGLLEQISEYAPGHPLFDELRALLGKEGE